MTAKSHTGIKKCAADMETSYLIKAFKKTIFSDFPTAMIFLMTGCTQSFTGTEQKHSDAVMIYVIFS